MIAVGMDVCKAFLDVAVHGEQTVQRHKNTPAGIARLVRQLSKRQDVHIGVEATGGYEEAVLDACARAGLWIARINARQARDFAKATGQLAKTDALDAQILAEMVCVLLPRLRRHVPAPAWQNELKSWLRRRNQVTEQIVTNTQQLAMTAPAVVKLMKKTLAALRHERVLIDAAMKALLHAHATPAIRSGKGMGPIFQATALVLLPELGQLNRQQIAKLAGVAPLNRDSGQSQGKRTIYGGRGQLRVALYMATLSAVRWDADLRAHYQQLRARGKVAKVALVACMRKLLCIVNARRRDELRSAGGLAMAA
jgi:transposase